MINPDFALPYYGALLISILSGLGFMLRRWPLGVDSTFSQHAVIRRSARIYYAGFFMIILPLLWVFFIDYFMPKYRVGEWGAILLGAILTATWRRMHTRNW